MKSTVCLMVKAPTRGKAKTRLAPIFGHAGAALFANALLRDALESWAKSSILIAHTGELSLQLKRRMSVYPCTRQGEGDLGERMERTLRHALLASEVAMAVGTDIPGLGDAVAERALHALRDHDAVLGPSLDGGFYLLALKSCPEGLLRDLPWSSPETLAATRSRLESRGMSVALLDERFDVDVPEDLERLREYLSANPREGNHTRHFLGAAQNRSISVVLPVLDEAARLGTQLDWILALRGVGQVIVADGGSTDGSIEIAEARASVTLVHSEPGRAAQMNAGAAVAFGGILLFVHADAQLPHDACEQIHSLLDTNAAQAGAFRLQTVYDPQGRQRPWVTPFLRLADLRSTYTRYPYGDQGLFVRASIFRAVGGFPRLPLFEDLALSMALHKLRPLGRALGPVRVSGRRFQARPLYYLALTNSLPLLYRLGVPAERLAKLYVDTR